MRAQSHGSHPTIWSRAVQSLPQLQVGGWDSMITAEIMPARGDKISDDRGVVIGADARSMSDPTEVLVVAWGLVDARQKSRSRVPKANKSVYGGLGIVADYRRELPPTPCSPLVGEYFEGRFPTARDV